MFESEKRAESAGGSENYPEIQGREERVAARPEHGDEPGHAESRPSGDPSRRERVDEAGNDEMKRNTNKPEGPRMPEPEEVEQNVVHAPGRGEQVTVVGLEDRRPVKVQRTEDPGPVVAEEGDTAPRPDDRDGREAEHEGQG